MDMNTLAIIKALSGGKGGGGGSSGGGVLVSRVDENEVLDKTWQEIFDADLAIVLRVAPDGSKITELVMSVSVIGAGGPEPEYIVTTSFNIEYKTSSADGHPAAEGGEE